MAELKDPKPGIYRFEMSGSEVLYRRYTGAKWFNSSNSVAGAAVTTWSSMSQERYWTRVDEALTVTRVAELDGTELKSVFKQTQMRLL